MPFIGNKPSAVPLTSADIADGIITSAKIVDGTIVNADINASSAIALSKLSTTGTADATTFLRGDGAYTAVSSDFVKLLSTSASASAAVSIDGYFTSTYDKYVLYLSGGYMSTANRLNVKVNKSGTAQTGSYDMVSEHQTNQPTDGYNAETDYFHIGYWSASSTRRNDAIINIFNPLGTTYAKGFIWEVGGMDGSYALWNGGAGVHNVNSAISGVTILNQAGHTFTIDKITLYGIK